MKDDLGDRMKLYEGKECSASFIPLLPICIRLDGKGFSKFTKGLNRPFDSNFHELMQQVTKFLVEEVNACIGYTQSDEISLILYSDNYQSKVFFDGKIQKLVSVLASFATAKFNELKSDFIPSKKDKLAYFDCRAWQVPNQTEAANTILWRYIDAYRNSISMLAQHYFSHNKLLGKSSKEKIEMLSAVGVSLDSYSDNFKTGSFVQRKIVTKKFSADDIAKLPPKHNAHKDKDLVMTRSEFNIINIPSFRKVINREAVIFEGAEYIIEA